jgi:hypothetical protein
LRFEEECFMPLIDDRTKDTDQRPKAYLPWVLVLTGFVVLWLGASTLVSVLPRLLFSSSKFTATVNPQQQTQRNLMAQAQAILDAGNAAAASHLIDQIQANAELDVSDKHTYFRTAAQVKRKSGDPAAAAGFYERFLSMGAGVSKEECRGCHSPGTISPARASDLETSSLGKEYVAALRAAGKLKTTRQRLRADLKQQPGDTRAHLLLFHVEKALGNARAAAEHADALKEASSGP